MLTGVYAIEVTSYWLRHFIRNKESVMASNEREESERSNPAIETEQINNKPRRIFFSFSKRNL